MKKKLKIGLIVQSELIPAWIYDSLCILDNSNEYEIKGINKTQIDDSESVLRKPNAVLLKYLSLEKKKFKVQDDAFKQRNLNHLSNYQKIEPLLNNDQRINRGKNLYLEQIQKLNLDVIINLTPEEPLIDLYGICKYGIWSFNCSEMNIFQNIPFGFWEIFNGVNKIHISLRISFNKLKNEDLISKSISWIDRHSINRTINNACWNASNLLTQKLIELGNTKDSTYLRTELIQRFTNQTIKSNSGHTTFKNPSVLITIWFISKLILSKSKEKIKAIFYFNQWILLYSFQIEVTNLNSAANFNKIIPPKDRFWADPFLITKDNKFFIFFEELIYKEKKGKISVMEIDKNGNYSNPTVVLEKPYHLSYPFLIQHENELFMIPETRENNCVELYKCVKFPDKWVKNRVLIDNIRAVDSTVIKHNNKYWLFCNVTTNLGASPHNDLFLFYSDNFLSTNWTSHQCNPIVSDVSNSRPAGSIFIENKKIYRPSQDSAKHYGHRIKLNEIVNLSTDLYEERTVSVIRPNRLDRIISTHTINKINNLTVSDAVLVRRKKLFN